MTPDLALLLVAAASAAAGAAAALRRRIRLPFLLLALLLFTAAGAHASILAIVTGDGRILPGRQLNPHVAQVWRAMSEEGSLPPLRPAFLLVAVAGHLLLWLPRPDRPGFFLPLPATAGFLVLLVALGGRAGAPPEVSRAAGPGKVGNLVIVRGSGDASRLVFSAGDPNATFLDVLHVHRGPGRPAEPRLLWTRDGFGFVLESRGERFFAVGTDGSTAGLLPERAHEWPRESRAAEPAPFFPRFREAEKSVADWIGAHGGVYVR